MSNTNSTVELTRDLLSYCDISWKESPAAQGALFPIVSAQDGKCVITADLQDDLGYWHKNTIKHEPCFTLDNLDGSFSNPHHIACPGIVSHADVSASRERALDAFKIYGIIFAALFLKQVFSRLWCKKRAFYRSPCLGFALTIKNATVPCRKRQAPEPM